MCSLDDDTDDKKQRPRGRRTTEHSGKTKRPEDKFHGFFK